MDILPAMPAQTVHYVNTAMLVALVAFAKKQMIHPAYHRHLIAINNVKHLHRKKPNANGVHKVGDTAGSISDNSRRRFTYLTVP